MLLILNEIENKDQKSRLEELYVTYRRPMQAMAQSVLRNRQDAEDAVQTIFVNIAKKEPGVLKPGANEKDVKNYLLAAVKNTAINMLKKKQVLLPDEDLDKISSMRDDDFENLICNRLEYEELTAMIRTLPPPYGDILYFHFVLELTARQVGRLTNSSVATVKVQLVRGKKLLLRKLEGTPYHDKK